MQALVSYLPNIYVLFGIIFYEGILGGLVYVNTFALVYEASDPSEREFALGAVGVADAAGIAIAGFMALILEPTLCKYQIAHGRPYCGIHLESKM